MGRVRVTSVQTAHSDGFHPSPALCAKAALPLPLQRQQRCSAWPAIRNGWLIRNLPFARPAAPLSLLSLRCHPAPSVASHQWCVHRSIPFDSFHSTRSGTSDQVTNRPLAAAFGSLCTASRAASSHSALAPEGVPTHVHVAALSAMARHLCERSAAHTPLSAESLPTLDQRPVGVSASGPVGGP